MGSTRKSVGHICFSGSFEYLEHDGEVYCAPLGNAFDLDGRRHGRWECTRKHFDSNRQHIVRRSWRDAKCFTTVREIQLRSYQAG